jgi:hypothetical protein
MKTATIGIHSLADHSIGLKDCQQVQDVVIGRTLMAMRNFLMRFEGKE